MGAPGTGDGAQLVPSAPMKREPGSVPAVVSPGLDTLSATSFLSRGRYSTTDEALLRASLRTYSFSTGA